MIVDANVWVSVLIPEDTHHQRSRRWIGEQTAAGAMLVMPTLALAEVAGALVRRTGREDLGRKAIEDMVAASNLRLVPVDMDLAREAASLAISQRLRGADAIYAALAEHLDQPLVTLDREMHNRIGGRIAVLEP